MDLQHHHAPVDGGARTEVRHRIEITLPKPRDADCVDAAQRRTVAPNGNVQGRETDGPAALVAARNSAAHGIVPAKQFARNFQLVVRERIADPGAADPRAPYTAGLAPDDVESMPLAQAHEEIEVALPSIPESEVLSRDHDAHSKAGDQIRLDELDGRHRAQTGVETQKRDSIDRQRAERGQLLPQPREPRRRVLSRKELERLRLECDKRRGDRPFAAECRKLPDQRSMAEMHAVEVADGSHAAMVLGSNVVPAANDLQLASPRRGPTRRTRNRTSRMPATPFPAHTLLADGPSEAGSRFPPIPRINATPEQADDRESLSIFRHFARDFTRTASSARESRCIAPRSIRCGRLEFPDHAAEFRGPA